MFGIDTYDVDAIAKFLPQLGLGRHKVVFNPRDLTGLSCLVQVGGHAVRTNHCYVQREGQIPVIQVLDPATCRQEPINRFWIHTGLAKAKYIDEHGDKETFIETSIRPELDEIRAFTDIYIEAATWRDAPLSVDLEVDMSTFEITVVGLAFETVEGSIRAISIPFLTENHNYWADHVETEIWLLIAKMLAYPKPKVFQNFIFDTMHLRRIGIETKGEIFDTMIINHWIDPELPKSLADLGRLYLTCDVWKGRDNWSSNESLWLYNAKDAGYTLLIYARQLERLRAENRISFLTQHLVPLATEVLALCVRGWRLDSNALSELRNSTNLKALDVRQTLENFAMDLLRPSIKYTLRKGKPKEGARYFRRSLSDSGGYQRETIPEGLNKLTKLGYDIFEEVVTEREFNPLSPLHIKDVLRACGVTIPIKDGAESSDENSLLKLLEQKSVPQEVKDNFIEPLLEYRGLSKLISTYCDVIRDPDEICRFSLNISGTVTSRFSSKQTPWETGFNAQNLPKNFRKVVIPHTPNNVIINLDFKQADPHMVAWLSGETQMLQILNDPAGDLHSHTASKIFGRPITKTDEFERKLGKACNNGLNYGMQLGKFIDTCRKQGLTLDPLTAKNAYEAYFRAYPGIKEWQNSIRQQITQTRTLVTPFGRKRYFYGHLDEKMINNALAYIPPTTVADALNKLWLAVKAIRPDLIVFSQTHDSLSFEVPATLVDETCKLLYDLSRQITFTVKDQICSFPIDLEIGSNWGQLNKWK